MRRWKVKAILMLYPVSAMGRAFHILAHLGDRVRSDVVQKLVGLDGRNSF